jgi:beta-lactamase regulating signal transducer with metallopeptidase domain
VTYVNAMGWTLTHFLWEGAAITLAYALADAVLRRASSHARYGLAVGAMGAMAASVAGTFAWLIAGEDTGSAGATMAATILTTGVRAARSHVAATSADFMPYVVMVWVAGVALLSVRLALQWRVVERCRRAGVRAVGAEWEERVRRVATRLGVGRVVPLCESAIADVPAVVGWLRPVILVPAGVLMNLTPEQVEAVLAHELAHVRRNDYLMNLLQTAVETVLFYHPAVWWVSRRVRQERENCCDDLAVEVCGNATAYARTLAELEQLRGVLPGLAMAANRGSLLERIERLVAPRQDGRAKPAAGVGALCLVAAAIVLVAAPRLLPSGAPGFTTVRFGLDSVAASSEAVQVVKAAPAPVAAENKAANKESYLDSLERAGYHNLSVDEMIAMKIHGVSAEQVKEMAALGFTLSPDDAVAARIHDVTPAFVKACKAQGLGDLSFDQLVA